jgi:hypothetical protein
MWTNAVHKSAQELWTDAVYKSEEESWPTVGHKSEQELWPNVGHNFARLQSLPAFSRQGPCCAFPASGPRLGSLAGPAIHVADAILAVPGRRSASRDTLPRSAISTSGLIVVDGSSASTTSEKVHAFKRNTPDFYETREHSFSLMLYPCALARLGQGTTLVH